MRLLSRGGLGVVAASAVTLCVVGLSSSDPSYRRAWKAVTSGGGGQQDKSGVPLTPEDRERAWAAKIIENHERRKKVADIATVVNAVAEQVEPAKPATEDKRQRMLLDIFDGRLGKLRLSLRSSAEAMLTIVGEFDAVATSEPGVVVVRGRPVAEEEDVECLVDAKRCSALEFTRRSDANGKDQYAITMKRLDDSSFLSLLLGGGAYPTEAAVTRWQELKTTYEGAAPSGRVVLVPEGGLDKTSQQARPNLDAGPLRPQGGALNAPPPARPQQSTDAPRQKREVRPVKPEILIPRTD